MLRPEGKIIMIAWILLVIALNSAGNDITGSAVYCEPHWEISEAGCNIDNTRIVIYEDKNNCGTTKNLPEDNGTYEWCDYCRPEWQETNSSCRTDDTINQYFTDINSCFEKTGLESDRNMPGNNTLRCDYCKPFIVDYNTYCNIITGTYTKYYIDRNYCHEMTGIVADIVPANITYGC